jgi:O-acetyl-ADP-ribose deacetylase
MTVITVFNDLYSNDGCVSTCSIINVSPVYYPSRIDIAAMGDRINDIILIPIRRHTVMEDRIEIIQGDITLLRVEAIVNAANTTLLGGGGVDGAIHRAAGPELVAETRKIGGCPTGEARSTKGYRLPAKWVIHTVGPVWAGGKKNEDALLADCYVNSFKVARSLGVKTIAFPSISTGAYMFPLERAIEIALMETKKVLDADPEFEKVLFACFGETVLKTYQNVYQRVFAN